MEDKIRIFITGVGGQGTLMATTLIAQAALIAGINANTSEIHGMAQRGGIVESGVTLGEIKSSVVSEAEADILLGFEPIETIRAANRCSNQTTIISNVTPIEPFTVSTGKEQYPNILMAFNKLKQRVKRFISIEADSLARSAGNILSVNIVMIGAMAKHANLPLTVEHYRKAIADYTKPKFLETNLKAFELGYSS